MTDFFSSKWWMVAWQGLTFVVPEDWNIGAIGGEGKSGYLRLDGSDMPRLEVKWAEAGSGAVDVPQLVDKYLKDLQKGKKGREVEVQRDVKLVNKRQMKGKKALECFTWTAETRGFGAAWFCPDCRRTVILQVMGEHSEPVQALAERIISSMKDHPDDGWATWATYGFICQTPAEFVLAGQRMMAGLIELDVSRERDQLHVARWGMAGIALKNKSLEDWGKKELSKRLKKFATEYRGESFRGHECICIEGRTTLPQEKLQSFVQHCMGKPFADRVKAYLWHCETSNKIYYVEGVLDREELELVNGLRERIPCHEGVPWPGESRS